MTVAIPDVLDFILLLIAIYVLYQGIEISHPVYVLLFTNLTFSFVATVINLLALLAFPFNIWTRFSLYSNLFSAHFHVSSWSIISILRYFYIEHKDWIERKWPDPKVLRYIVLAAQFSSFVAVTLINLGLFAVFGTPYGWPSKDFFNNAPQNIKLLFASCFAILLTLPVLVTGIFYVLLACSRPILSISENKFSNEADINRTTLNPGNLNLEFFDELQRCPIESELNNQLQNELAITSFEYNLILKQSGQQYKKRNIKIVNEITVSHGHFGENNIDGESFVINNSRFQNSLDDEISEREKKKKKSGQQKPNIICVREADPGQLTDQLNFEVKNNGGECSTISNSCFQNALDNVEMYESEKKKSRSGQQNPKLIHVREADHELKISAIQLHKQLNPYSRNETSNISENFAFDAIEVDPTFQVSNNYSTENDLNNPTPNNSGLNKSETNSIILNDNLAENRQEAERVSALRSLKTNLILILLVGLSTLFLLIPSNTWQNYYCIVNTSIQKGLMPVVTTMANFGTVCTVATQLWKTFVETKLFSFFCKYS